MGRKEKSKEKTNSPLQDIRIFRDSPSFLYAVFNPTVVDYMYSKLSGNIIFLSFKLPTYLITQTQNIGSYTE